MRTATENQWSLKKKKERIGGLQQMGRQGKLPGRTLRSDLNDVKVVRVEERNNFVLEESTQAKKKC